MKQEDKDLLLKDLCVRIPYGVKVDINGETYMLNAVTSYREVSVYDGTTNLYDSEEVKPYLFPLSSMTEKQEEKLKNILGSTPSFDSKNELFYDMWGQSKVYLSDVLKAIEFFNKNHLDYNGLIEKSLALDATGLNIY